MQTPVERKQVWPAVGDIASIEMNHLGSGVIWSGKIVKITSEGEISVWLEWFSDHHRKPFMCSYGPPFYDKDALKFAKPNDWEDDLELV